MERTNCFKLANLFASSASPLKERKVRRHPMPIARSGRAISFVRMCALVLLLLFQTELTRSDLSAITIALRDKRFAEAVEMTRQQLAKDGRDPRVWTLQGLAHSGLNLQGDALKDFRHAVALA